MRIYIALLLWPIVFLRITIGGLAALPLVFASLAADAMGWEEDAIRLFEAAEKIIGAR